MRSILISAFAALVVTSFGCEKKTAAVEVPKTADAKKLEGTPGATADTGDIILGEVGSLTGAEAAFGISTRNGIEMALEEANAAGGVKGRKVKVVVYDDQSKPEEAASATTRLVTQDKVILVLGEVASSNSMAMAPICQDNKVPMISPSSTNKGVTETGDYVFRVCFIDQFQGYVMAKFARDDLKFKNAFILKDVKSSYSVGLTEVFEKTFSEMGGKVLGIESYSKGDTDFRSQLTAIKKLKPEALYVPGYYNDVGIIARQARELGVKTVMMGGDGWDSEKLFELGGKAIEGSYVSNHYSPEDPSPRVQNFIVKYKAKFSSVPDSLAALGYDATGVAIEAMRRAPNLSGPVLRDELAKTKDFPGVAGSITMNEKRDAVKSAVVLQVVDGKFKYVTTIKP